MKITPSKIISLLFFVFSGLYLYTAYQIQVFAFDEKAPFNAKTFPIYLGYAGLILSALYIILPETKPTNVNLRVLDYKKSIFLVVLMVLYGITILRAGYFLSTSIFLVLSYIVLGERRWLWIFIMSFPFIAIFMYLLHGLLNIYLRDPFLKFLGIMG
ncbi:MAG: tricarboxylic transport tctB [Candidatus Pelagibacter sp.]|nr:tricarboxylic transport tctB [Candidatus Pelagibacter sp.]